MGTQTVNALQDVTVSVEKGEFLGIFGPSGSGKSTMLHIMSALDSPTQGKVYIAGEEINGASEQRLAEIRNKYVGFVFQFFNLVPHLRAWENVALPLTLRGVDVDTRRRRAKELLEKVGLGQRTTHKPNELSGGERQRVAIARALANDPRVIFLDEPTGNLDQKVGRRVMNTIQTLNAEGRTIVMATHDSALVEYNKRILYLKSGKITKEEGGKQ